MPGLVGAVLGLVGAVLGQCWCRPVLVGAGRCWPVSVGAVFILNGMIFSFLDEKRVFKGVI